MGYRINYVAEEEMKEHMTDDGGRIRRMTAVFLLIFCLSARVSSGETLTRLKEYLIPGEKTVTETAFLNFVENLREGEGVGESAEVFCREILSDAAESLH